MAKKIVIKKRKPRGPRGASVDPSRSDMRSGGAAARSNPKEPATSQENSASFSGSAVVRMYNNILGDCFLLRFPAKGREVKILIDCGALQGMPNAKEIMQEIAADIAGSTKERASDGRQVPRLDVVVATHEHVDHLSGFAQAKSIFDDIEIGELWLAWTEDDADPEAARIKARRKKTLDLLFRLDGHFNPSVSELEEEYDAEEAVMPFQRSDDVSQLFAFTGDTELDGPSLASAGSGGSARMTTGEILSYLKKKAGKVRYFTPGSDPILLPTEPPVQVYVLGPPKDEKLLKRSNPRGDEVYLRSGTDDLAAYLSAAIQLDKARETFNPDEEKAFELAMPFDSHRMRHLSQMRPFDGETALRYLDAQDDWRRIDRDWLHAAEQLALKLDSDTNNTSLVLAFVLGETSDRRVMLFPGDAQVGNWLSWQQYIWPKGSTRGDQGSISTAELLASTVLYKVGHHASHNATLRAAGLELMTHPNLAVMIPVQEEFARKSKGWNMPFPALLSRLTEKTKGRVLRADKSRHYLEDESRQRADSAGEMSRAGWEEFLQRVRHGPMASNGAVELYVEYYVP